MMTNDKVLIKIQNLQKYFPLPRKSFFQLRKDYVKANVNVSFDIYQGETVGIVGESGCGKSTLGRTIIQLQKQTGGSSLYYGETLENFAPNYILKIIRNLSKTSQNYDQAKASLDALKTNIKEAHANYKKLASEDPHRVEAKAHLDDLYEKYRVDKAQFEETFYNTFRLFGGLVLDHDLDGLKKEWLHLYRLYRKRVRLNTKILRLQAKTNPNAIKLDRFNELLEITERTIQEHLNLIEKRRSGLQRSERFDTYESFRDDGIDLSALTRSEIRRLQKDLQIIFQDPYSSLDPKMKVSDSVGEGLIIHKMFASSRQKAYREYVENILEKCGLERSYAQRYPHQFSGGQRQRIGIARALALKPKFIVCDEAVSALDVSIQSQVINLLQDLKKDHDLTYLFITHDLSVVRYISNRIGVMYFGRLVELAPAEEIFINPQHPYTRQLLNAMPELEDETYQKKIWPLATESQTFEFHYEKGPHKDQDWVEVGPDHYVACTLKTVDLESLSGGEHL
jgi:peptide/nickel transport system ATP-binding protein